MTVDFLLRNSLSVSRWGDCQNLLMRHVHGPMYYHLIYIKIVLHGEIHYAFSDLYFEV